MAQVTQDKQELETDAEGQSYTVQDTGTVDTLLLAIMLASDNDNTAATYTAFGLGGTAFPTANRSSIVKAGSVSPFAVGCYGFFDDGDTWPAAGARTLTLTISTSTANEGVFLCELQNVDQTTPVTHGPDPIKNTSASECGPHTVNASASDRIYMLCSVTSGAGLTINAPANLSSGDAWSTIHDNVANLIGGTLNQGSVYAVDVTDDITAESIQANITGGTATNAFSTLVVVKGTGLAGGAVHEVLTAVQQNRRKRGRYH